MYILVAVNSYAIVSIIYVNNIALDRSIVVIEYFRHASTDHQLQLSLSFGVEDSWIIPNTL